MMAISLEKILISVVLSAAICFGSAGCGTVTYFLGSELVRNSELKETKTQKRKAFYEGIMTDDDTKRIYGNPQNCHAATFLEFDF